METWRVSGRLLAGGYNSSPTNIIKHRGFETTNKGIGDTSKEIWKLWTRLAATSTWRKETMASAALVFRTADGQSVLQTVLCLKIHMNHMESCTGWWFGTWMLFFPSVGNFIIPIDKLIIFRGVGIPPTSINNWNTSLKMAMTTPSGLDLQCIW